MWADPTGKIGTGMFEAELQPLFCLLGIVVSIVLPTLFFKKYFPIRSKEPVKEVKKIK